MLTPPSITNAPSPILAAFTHEFARYRALAEGAARQLPFEALREPLDHTTNSIAVVVKHLAGNLRSRWTDPLTTDGEKPWRHRDREFIDDFPDEPALWTCWNAGWAALDHALASFSDADLIRIITIRSEPHTLMLALTRSATHAAYHTGQITLIARTLASRRGLPWTTLTIPRGGSEAFNARWKARSGSPPSPS